jgi:DivIVA domain-containing protein
VTPPSTAAPSRVEPRRFDTVLRGYDRGQVDAHIARLVEENAALRRQGAEADRRRQTAEQHAAATEGEFRKLQSQRQGSSPEESFGFRAEKLLRLAEQEAADLRGSAAREAAALLEQARADAEKHRHEVEQSLIARSAQLDEQATQRSIELQERERQIAEQLAAARSEAESLHEAARRAADQLRQQAEAAAETVRLRAAQDAQRMREQAQQEVTRLTSLQRDVRAELARLATVLAAEMTKPGQPAGGARHREGSEQAEDGGPAQPSDGTDKGRRLEPARAAGR